MEDDVVGLGAAQLGHLGRNIHRAGLGDDLLHQRDAQFLRMPLGAFDGIAAELGVAVDQGHRGLAAGLGLRVDELELDLDHGLVGGAGHEVVRCLHGVGQVGGERRAGGQRGAQLAHLSRRGLGPGGGVAIEDRRAVRAHDLLEHGHGLVHLVGRVFTDVAQPAPGHAAVGVAPLAVVAQALVQTHAGKGEHAGDGGRGAHHDLAALRESGAERQRAQPGSAQAGLHQTAAAGAGDVSFGLAHRCLLQGLWIGAALGLRAARGSGTERPEVEETPDAPPDLHQAVRLEHQKTDDQQAEHHLLDGREDLDGAR